MKDNGFTADFEYGTLHISGNEEYGFRPYQLMVSAIAVCSAGVLRKILEKKKLTIEDMKVQTVVERNESEANRITKITLHYTIKAPGLKADALEKAMVLAHKHCPMAQSVKESIEIVEEYTLNSN